MIIFKYIIPDESDNNDYDNSKVLYIIQIIFASPISLFVGIYLFLGFLASLGIFAYLNGCDEKFDLIFDNA